MIYGSDRQSAPFFCYRQDHSLDESLISALGEYLIDWPRYNAP